MKRARILLGGLFHETHTFLPETTQWRDFDVARGAELLAKEHDDSPTAGFLTTARRLGWEVIPTLGAHALPSGPVADDGFETFWGEFEAAARPALEAGVDAIFFVLHGAMATPRCEDVEGELLARVRALPGAAALPLFGVLDLHANVSRRMCELANGLVAYRCNPHTDGKATGQRAAELLERCLRTGVVPRMTWCRVPLVWAPPGTGTQNEPMRSLVELAGVVEREEPAVWACNVAPGFSFADTAETGLTLTAVSAGPIPATQSALRRLAALAWELRSAGVVDYPSVDDVLAAGLTAATDRASGPVLLVEPADNIGAGAPGDGTGILRALLRRPVGNALVAINDPAMVRRLEGIDVGGRCRLELGGRGWSGDAGPVEVEVRLVSRGDGRFRLEDLQSHLASMSGSTFDMGPCAVAQAGGVTILITSRKTPPFDLAQFRSQGLQPETFAVIGVKAAVAHRRAYDPIARGSYFVDTPGPCSSNLRRFDYRRLRRPVFPLDAAAAGEPRFA